MNTQTIAYIIVITAAALYLPAAILIQRIKRKRASSPNIRNTAQKSCGQSGRVKLTDTGATSKKD